MTPATHKKFSENLAAARAAMYIIDGVANDLDAVGMEKIAMRAGLAATKLALALSNIDSAVGEAISTAVTRSEEATSNMVRAALASASCVLTP